MRLDEFINKYVNTKVDYDHAYGAQCVDLFRQYCNDVLNIPHTGSCSTSGGAKDLYLDWDKMPLEKKYFKRIPAKKIEMKLGDVVVWNETSTNIYGHVAIFISMIDEKTILVFEQNGVKQDGAKLVYRAVDNMLGVLRWCGR